MPKKPFEPNFHTPEEDFCKEELNKIANNGISSSSLNEELQNDQADIVWEAEQIAKSTGIYLEFDRSIKGAEKHWYYMIRIANPSGGPISREQWRVYNEMPDKHRQNPYGEPTLRITNRQTIQFHWIKKSGVIDLVRSLAEVGMNSLNGCGDNTRNPMACPLSRFSDIFNASKIAHLAGSYFQLPIEPFIKIFAINPDTVRIPDQSFAYGKNLLNRKFKIGVSTVHKNADGSITRDNCVEMRTHDMGIAPLLDKDSVTAYQIYVGGGQGERNGKPSSAMLSQPIGIVTEKQLLPTMDAVVAVHKDWGDRQNRHWARVKYVIKKQGPDWYRDQVSARLGHSIEKPDLDLDIGPRHLHHGWWQQPSNHLWTFGAYIENGRLQDDSPNGKLKSMIHDTMEKYDVELSFTPNQDVLFSNIEESAKEEFEAHLESYGYGRINGKPYSSLRLRSGACVGRDTCRLTYTDSEKLEPELLGRLEEMGWGDMAESIGITGCERQCFRPGTKTIGLVGSGLNRYMVKLFGDETGSHQGVPLVDSAGESLYLRSVLREELPILIEALFRNYSENKENDESMGAFHRRVGADHLIAFLKDNPDTSSMMEKPFNTDTLIP